MPETVSATPDSTEHDDLALWPRPVASAYRIEERRRADRRLNWYGQYPTRDQAMTAYDWHLSTVGRLLDRYGPHSDNQLVVLAVAS